MGEDKRIVNKIKASEEYLKMIIIRKASKWKRIPQTGSEREEAV